MTKPRITPGHRRRAALYLSPNPPPGETEARVAHIAGELYAQELIVKMLDARIKSIKQEIIELPVNSSIAPKLASRIEELETVRDDVLRGSY
jgi:hypothetical protein